MGYEWPFDNERSVLTIFSASNYSGKSNNKGAVALLGPPLKSGTTKLKAVDKSRFTASYGDLTLIQHEAVPLSALVLEQRTLDCLWRLVISRRELLRQAYRAADVFGSGELSAVVWAGETRRVLEVAFPFFSQREVLLGSGRNGDNVDYEHFLCRYELRQPALEPLYPQHEVLLALLHRADSTSSGIVSLAALDTVCDLMREQFGHTLPLCCDGRTLLRALGHTTASDAQASGSIDIATFSSGFELIQVSSEAATGKPSIFGLLRHANKDSSLEAFAANVH